jgi:hypothetical protein
VRIDMRISAIPMGRAKERRRLHRDSRMAGAASLRLSQVLAVLEKPRMEIEIEVMERGVGMVGGSAGQSPSLGYA